MFEDAKNMYALTPWSHEDLIFSTKNYLTFKFLTSFTHHRSLSCMSSRVFEMKNHRKTFKLFILGCCCVLAKDVHEV